MPSVIHNVDDTVPGAALAWVAALDFASQPDLGFEDYRLELAVICGRTWIRSADPEVLAFELGLPLARVSTVVDRLLASGLWTRDFSLIDIPDGGDGSLSKWLLGFTLDVFVAAGLVSVSGTSYDLALPGASPLDLSALLRIHRSGGLYRADLRSFLRTVDERGACRRFWLLVQLRRAGLITPATSMAKACEVWTFSRDVRQSTLTLANQSPDREQLIGELAPVRLPVPWMKIFIDTIGLERTAEIWRTDPTVVKNWLAA